MKKDINGAEPKVGSQLDGCADLPQGLSELRYHLKEALDSLNKFSGYNDAGKKYVVEATERSLDQAYKHLKYFQHNVMNEPRGAETLNGNPASTK